MRRQRSNGQMSHPSFSQEVASSFWSSWWESVRPLQFAMHWLKWAFDGGSCDFRPLSIVPARRKFCFVSFFSTRWWKMRWRRGSQKWQMLRACMYHMLHWQMVFFCSKTNSFQRFMDQCKSLQAIIVIFFFYQIDHPFYREAIPHPPQNRRMSMIMM